MTISTIQYKLTNLLSHAVQFFLAPAYQDKVHVSAGQLESVLLAHASRATGDNCESERAFSHFLPRRASSLTLTRPFPVLFDQVWASSQHPWQDVVLGADPSLPGQPESGRGQPGDPQDSEGVPQRVTPMPEYHHCYYYLELLRLK